MAQLAATMASHYSTVVTFSIGLLLSPVLGAIVMVNVGSDVRADLESAAARAGRTLERLWAIILIQFVQNMIYNYALGTIAPASGPAFLGALLVGTLFFMVLATLVYADIDASLAPNVRTLALVPSALFRSITLSSRNFSRALALLGVQIFGQTLISLVELLLQSQHVPRPELWPALILGTIMNVLATAYITVVYLDNVQRETEASRS
ncbi:MAG: hypothetical protein M3R35_01750 [Candidatus Eremiobacteraeota bacterium]|nr:hypothetical protein [Candidatus Eremiobacteraeota bacterium]